FVPPPARPPGSTAAGPGQKGAVPRRPGFATAGPRGAVKSTSSAPLREAPTAPIELSSQSAISVEAQETTSPPTAVQNVSSTPGIEARSTRITAEQSSPSAEISAEHAAEQKASPSVAATFAPETLSESAGDSNSTASAAPAEGNASVDPALLPASAEITESAVPAPVESTESGQPIASPVASKSSLPAEKRRPRLTAILHQVLLPLASVVGLAGVAMVMHSLFRTAP